MPRKILGSKNKDKHVLRNKNKDQTIHAINIVNKVILNLIVCNEIKA